MEKPSQNVEKPTGTISENSDNQQNIFPEQRRNALITELNQLNDKAEPLRHSYIVASNEATNLLPDFSKLQKLDPVNDLRWVNGALMEIQKIPNDDYQVALAMPDATLTRLRGQIVKAQSLLDKNPTTNVPQREKQIIRLQHLGDKAETLRQSYLYAVNEATGLSPDQSHIQKLDTKNDLRWVNGAIEESNAVPSGDSQVDQAVPDRTLVQLRALIIKAKKIIQPIQ